MNRRKFNKRGLLGIAGFFGPPDKTLHKPLQEGNRVDLDVIKEFVIAGHNDFEKVKSMLESEPNLMFARHDWGNGDFEEAIEGAGHVGNKEIANYLIQQGARVNLFVLTMLGEKDIVIPTLETYPVLIQAMGPHGFSLLHHAKVGGTDAQEIYDYLEDHGLNQTKINRK